MLFADRIATQARLVRRCWWEWVSVWESVFCLLRRAGKRPALTFRKKSGTCVTKSVSDPLVGNRKAQTAPTGDSVNRIARALPICLATCSSPEAIRAALRERRKVPSIDLLNLESAVFNQSRDVAGYVAAL